VRGEGAFLGDARLRVREPVALEQALVATGFSYESDKRAIQAERMRSLLPRARDIRRAGAASVDLSWLAAGRLDAYLERGLQSWDWAAGRLLVEEAGGVVAWLDEDWPGMVAATSPELLADLRPYL
jgi:myo-inositol-1(or 4)-monophosphatase